MRDGDYRHFFDAEVVEQRSIGMGLVNKGCPSW